MTTPLPESKTIGTCAETLRNLCATDKFTPCTTPMAGFVHGLLTQLGVEKRYHYAVLETVLGCEIVTFSQLTYHTCKVLLDRIQNNEDEQNLFYAVYNAMILAGIDENYTITPGMFVNWLTEIKDMPIESLPF